MKYGIHCSYSMTNFITRGSTADDRYPLQPEFIGKYFLSGIIKAVVI